MRVKYDEVGTVGVSGRALIGGVVAGAVLVGGGYGLYELSWAVKANSTDRAAAINRQSLGFQAAKVDEVNRKEADVSSLRLSETDPSLTPEQVAGIKVQEQAIISRYICPDWRQITPTYRQGLDPDQVASLTTMCQFQP